MRKALVVTVTLAILVLSPLTSAAQSLVGAWTLEQMEVTSGDNVGTFSSPGLMVFTGTHYSLMWIRATEPRPQLREDDADADRLASLRAFAASGGTYTLDGSTLTAQVSLAPAPNSMNTSVSTGVRFEGDDTVWLTLGNRVLKWVRAE